MNKKSAPLLVIVALLALAPLCSAQARCRVSDLKIGSSRDAVLAELTKRNCELKLSAAPSDGLQSDIMIPKDVDEKYWYYEVIFSRDKLVAVWSYSRIYKDSKEAFLAVYEELVPHSKAVEGSRPADMLGMRTLDATLSLRRPISEELQQIEPQAVIFDIRDLRVAFQLKKSKDGTEGVMVVTVRS